MPTGLDATLGFALEEEYGVYKEPDTWIEAESFSPKLEKQYTQSRPLRGRPGVPIARHTETTRSVAGSISLEVPNQGFGAILNLLHGEEVEPEEVKEGAYLQTHPIGVTAPNGKSLTLQANKPTAAADQAFTYLGGKFTQAAFSCDTSAQLKCALDLIAADGEIEQELVEAEYPEAIKGRTFDEAEVEIGGEAIAEGLIIHSFNLVVPLPMKDGRFGLGQGGTQAEPIGFNDSMEPTLEFAAEFSNAELLEYYLEQEELAVTIKFVGEAIKETAKEEIQFVLPAGKFTGEDPEVGGPDLLDQTANFMVLDDIENPLVTVKYQSTDETL